MLVIGGEIKLNDAKTFDEARDVLTKMMAETHKEEGCHAYAFSQDAADPTIIRIFEKWEDQAALDGHMKSPHMAEFNKAVGGFGVAGVSITLYTVSGETKLM